MKEIDGTMYTECYSDIFEVFKNGWAIELPDIRLGKVGMKTIENIRQFSDYLKNAWNPSDLENIGKGCTVHNWREWHLFFDCVPMSDDPTVMVTFHSITKLEDQIRSDYVEKSHRIYTSQIIMTDLSLLDKGFRIFIHPAITGEKPLPFEITLGNCERTGRELRPTHNLPQLLMSGEFGDLY